MAGPSFSNTRKLAQAKAHEYTLVQGFNHGYRNREDDTTLPPGILIQGSQNVLTNTNQRTSIRKGYTLDGAANTDLAPIGGQNGAMGVFDWFTSGGGERNMRAGFLTDAGNDGKLQFRHVAADGTVTWTDLLTGLTSIDFNFITFWDVATLQTQMIAVNGTRNMYLWNGQTATVLSATNTAGIVYEIEQPGDDSQILVSGGYGYAVGNTLTLSGGDNGAVVEVLSITTGALSAVNVNSGGSGYAVNDEIVVTGGTGGQFSCICKVTTISGSSVTGLQILGNGTGYTSHTAVATTALSGVGTGLTVDTTATGGAIASWGFTTDALHGTTYSAGTTYDLTGGAGSGAHIRVGSVVSGTITKTGTETWAEAGFIFDLVLGTGSVIINGTTYTYDTLTFIGDTTTLYGITPDPSALAAGSLVIQSVTIQTIEVSGAISSIAINTQGSGYSVDDIVTIAGGTGGTAKVTSVSSGMVTGLQLVTAGNGYTTGAGVATSGGGSGLTVNIVADQELLTGVDLIGVLQGRVFIGALNSSFIFMSAYLQTNTWDASATVVLPNPPKAIIPQEDSIYISSGQDQWYHVYFQLSADLTTQALVTKLLNTASQQAAQSQAATGKIANSIAFLSFEPVIEAFGRVPNILAEQAPQMSDLSSPIVNDMNNYNMTNAAMAYYRKFFYVALPHEGKVLVYNMTDAKNPYWEAPQILPISRFSIIGGQLYGHSSQVSETYQLFTGTADRVTPDSQGAPIAGVWTFAYDNFGSRYSYKKCTKMYVEGYINANTTLTTKLTYELDGCKTVKTFELDGSNSQFVCIGTDESSLGKVSLGKVKLGGDKESALQDLPPKFRWFPTFSNTDFFESSVSFSVIGLNQQMELLAFGLAVSGSSEIPTQKYD